MKDNKHNSTSLVVAFAAAILAVGSLSATVTNMVNNITREQTALTGAKGDKGETGATGEKGETGEAGKDGQNGQDGKDGEDGLTPYIGENGNWWIGERDTNVKAEGVKGETGENGKDGKNGLTPSIGENGNWWIGDKDTGIKAEGKDGAKGDTGEKGDKGDQGEKGETGATGAKGDQGEKGDTGAAGKDGKDGINGQDGTSMRTGNGAPSSDLGIDGDSYIDLSTWDYYTKNSGEWTKKGNIHNEKETYTVSFDTDGGEAIEPITVEKGSRIDGIQAKKSECYLKYWELNGDRWNPLKDTVTCDITLKAVWGTGSASHSGNTLTYYTVLGVNTDNITAPDMVDGYKITEIGKNCFSRAFKFKSITIPEGVTTIGEKAFYSAISLTEVNFPSTLKRINKSAFEATEKLDHFDFSNTKLEDIGDYAFKSNTLITSLSFPKSLNSIGKSAVEGCTALTSVSFDGGTLGPNINNNTLMIGEKCFYGCSALEAITLKHVAFNLGQAAFYGIKSDFVLTYPSRTASQFKTYCSTKAPFRNPDGEGFTEGTIKCLDSIKVSSLDD